MPAAPPLTVRIAEDRLAASLVWLRPAEATVSLDELLAALQKAGVVHGIQVDVLERLVNQITGGSAPREPVEVARGTPATPGRDASFEFLVGASSESAEGAIDFHERRRFTRVASGERIALWRPAVEGQPGRGVDGSRIEPPPVSQVPFARGENVELVPVADGGLEIRATLEGVTSLERGNRVAVTDVLRVEGDVDYSVGNIETSGMVVIRGSVRSSFTVRAGRGITIQGTIEDAIVETGGDLRVGRGILGGEFGHVKVGGNLQLHHAQNARIECAGDVDFGDADLGSTIRCGGELRAVESHGRLSGGDYEAVGGVVARELGPALGAPPRLRVGVDGALEDHIVELEMRLAALDEHDAEDALVYQGQETLSRERAAELRKRIAQRFEVRSALAELRERRAAFDAERVEPVQPTITVQKALYAGVRLVLRGARLEIHDQLGPRRFVFDREEFALRVEESGTPRARSGAEPAR